MELLKKYNHTSWIIPTIFIAWIGLWGCQKPKGYKTESGLIFYVYNQNSADTTVRVGNVLKLNYKKYVNDSLVENTYYGMPKYEQVMPGLFYPYEAGEIYPYMHKGDSVILHQDADTLLGRRLFYQVPAYVSKGDKIVTHFKVVDVFTNDSLAGVDLRAEYPRAIERNRKTGPARIREYIKQNGISATMTSDTVFMETIRKGQGEAIQSGDIINIRFKAQTFSGHIFADNMDEDADPFDYEVLSGLLPASLEQCMLKCRVGDHARFYLPAMKAYGASPPPGVDQGFQDLIFEIEILDKNKSGGESHADQ